LASTLFVGSFVGARNANKIDTNKMPQLVTPLNDIKVKNAKPKINFTNFYTPLAFQFALRVLPIDGSILRECWSLGYLFFRAYLF